MPTWKSSQVFPSHLQWAMFWDREALEIHNGCECLYKFMLCQFRCPGMQGLYVFCLPSPTRPYSPAQELPFWARWTRKQSRKGKQDSLMVQGRVRKTFPNLLFYLPGKKKIFIRKFIFKRPCEDENFPCGFQGVGRWHDFLWISGGIVTVVQFTACLRLITRESWLHA